MAGAKAAVGATAGVAKAAAGATAGATLSASTLGWSARPASCDFTSLYVQRELTLRASIKLKPPRHKKRYHVYVSRHNPGALQLLHEVARLPYFSGLKYTDDLEQAEQAEAFLLYLNALTWAPGPASSALTKETLRHIKKGVMLRLAHEAPQSLEGVSTGERHGIKFSRFFDMTPRQLIAAGVYTPIATRLKGGVYREASLVMLAAEIAREPSSFQWVKVAQTIVKLEAAMGATAEAAKNAVGTTVGVAVGATTEAAEAAISVSGLGRTSIWRTAAPKAPEEGALSDSVSPTPTES